MGQRAWGMGQGGRAEGRKGGRAEGRGQRAEVRQKSRTVEGQKVLSWGLRGSRLCLLDSHDSRLTPEDSRLTPDDSRDSLLTIHDSLLTEIMFDAADPFTQLPQLFT